MTPEEEFLYLKGQVDAMSQLCSILVTTHVIGDNIANMFKNLASKVQNQPGLSAIDQIYVKGYGSLVTDIEAAQKTVRDAGLLASLDQKKQH